MWSADRSETVHGRKNHRHGDCDELFTLKGKGHLPENGEQLERRRRRLFAPRTKLAASTTPERRRRAGVGLDGAGSIEASGYEVDPETH
jgi:hypothetical protein